MTTASPGSRSSGEKSGEAGSFIIAIDGPSGTGKSTVARRVAAELNAGYLDTGAMYRMVTLSVLRAGVDPVNDTAVVNVLEGLNFSSPLSPGHQTHLLDGEDVTDEIRGQAVTLAVTPVSANPAVRAWLFDRQQLLAHSGRMVVEGRDIGTVIAPEADLKIYLTADAAERARRRHTQNVGATVGGGLDLAAVAQDLERRDTHDSRRVHAPLQAAPDAVVIDSSQLALPETVAKVLELAAARGIR
ncbi:cytidylate kinase [Nakamurella panacisegetis]|uniref:Cytidylate kinase n=1 Tax=Nakamurella panacisegetis TaxID=1090615 RepID=A0A1H0PU52_9ACTN|nr:(d)CMP kinase [Nakamurella panacisegetis]SDP08066.1 cytidylate kinase [Nakamurella panacisegetis]